MFGRRGAPLARAAAREQRKKHDAGAEFFGAASRRVSRGRGGMSGGATDVTGIRRASSHLDVLSLSRVR
jgi:hypothetical protein